MTKAKTRVFLILQKQLKTVHREKRIKKVSAYCLGPKRWIPVFEITSEAGETLECSLRVQSAQRVRTWASLSGLASWLVEELAVDVCEAHLKPTNRKEGVA